MTTPSLMKAPHTNNRPPESGQRRNDLLNNRPPERSAARVDARSRRTSTLCAPEHLLAPLCLILAFFTASTPARAQITLTTAVDLALSHDARIREAEADVAKAHSSLDQARDAYIPTVVAGAGLGQSYGYSPNPPTLFQFNAGSLVYSASQHWYIQAGRHGVGAADLSLADVRQAVAQDASLGFLALRHDQQREAVLADENHVADRLVDIVTDRLSAGQDTTIDLTQAELTAAQYRLARLRAAEDTARDRDHLALLMGMQPDPRLTAEGDLPTAPAPSPPPSAGTFLSPAIAAAYASADAKQDTAIGDSQYRLRPQFQLVTVYNRYATFTNSFTQLQALNPNEHIGPNEGVFAIQITLPIYDREHQAKAATSAADALRARAEADEAQQNALDGQLKLRHSLEVLHASSDVARLEQQLARQQLDALTARLNATAANPNAPPLSPKDEQNSRLAEREKALAVIDADYSLEQAQIQLLRQTGQLDSWLQQAAAGRLTSAPAPIDR